jgi:hypothetical protein
MRSATKYLLVGLLVVIQQSSIAQIPGQPANSWVSGQNWYCNEGFQKSGNECVSIFATFPGGRQPPNSWVSGQNWYCREGYEKLGNECISIFASFPGGRQPSNSWVSGQNWYCREGYQKSGKECVSIFASFPRGEQPANSWVSGQNWYCREGFQKSGTECVSIFADFPRGEQPANSWVSGQNWYCREGFKKNLNKCVSIFEFSGENISQKVDQVRSKESIKDTRNLIEPPRGLSVDSRKIEGEKKQKEQAKVVPKMKLEVSNTQPSADGVFFINIRTNIDTASLLIDGIEEGGRADGNYVIKRVARAGQTSQFRIQAVDVYGGVDQRSISVTRLISDSSTDLNVLNPERIKKQAQRDAVAVIIGIENYKNLPRADFAIDDAGAFYDYAIRALGVRPENIKLLVDADADEVGIYRAFKTWLPSRVRSNTEVYVFYSGHGLPTADGQGLYVLPQRADRDFIDKTAITQAEINAAIQASKPKSVTIFLDTCYSGQARTGETLVASARPVSLKATTSVFPDNFTVITASRADQISSSSPDLKHGIFSYYLMRGMEGDADINRDGRITAGEMQSYLAENVSRHAGMLNRKQEPQLIGDAGRVLVGR